MRKNSAVLDAEPAPAITPEIISKIKKEDMKQAVVEKFSGKAAAKRNRRQDSATAARLAARRRGALTGGSESSENGGLFSPPEIRTNVISGARQRACMGSAGLDFDRLVSGHDFSRADKPFISSPEPASAGGTTWLSFSGPRLSPFDDQSSRPRTSVRLRDLRFAAERRHGPRHTLFSSATARTGAKAQVSFEFSARLHRLLKSSNRRSLVALKSSSG